MLQLVTLGAALFAAITAWLSLGTIGFAGAGGQRLAVLPSSPISLLWPAAVLALVLFLRRQGASLLPLWLLAFVLLPWLPLGVPTAFLIWARPASIVIWVAVVVLTLASAARARGVTVALPPHPALAAAAALILFSLSAWRAAPMVPAGDEPHYLVITQSLLLDGDLTIEDVHRRGDYRGYFAGDLAPHVQRLGRDGRIYSVHAPGLPVLVAPAFALAGYRGVVIVLVLIAAAGTALAWHLAWIATKRSDAAWFAWAAVTLPVTAIFQSFTVYPDGPGGVLALTGLWALIRAETESQTGSGRAAPWAAHGAALALLPWFHSRFAVLAVAFGALVLLRLSRTPNPAAKAVAFLSIPAASAIVWVGFFIAIYGTPDPSAPYADGELGAMAFVPGGLGGLLFDQRFGLIAYAPVVACALAGLVAMVAQPRWRRSALELLFVATPYLLTVTHFAMWWGGWSAPARFFAPLLPLLALPAAVAWVLFSGPTGRFLAMAAVSLTGLASMVVVGVDRGRLAYNTREAPALWLEWFGRLADLTAAAPLWARDTDAPLFRAIAVWAIVAAAACLVLRRLERLPRFGNRTLFQTAGVALLAAAVMTASTALWSVAPRSHRTVVPSQLALLEAVAAGSRVVAFQLNPLGLVAPSNVPGRIRLELERTPARRPGGRDTPPLFALPPLPAGEYRIRVAADDRRGWLMFGIARESRDPFAVRTVQLPVDSLDLIFPMPVRGLVIRGDEDAWRVVRRLSVEPLHIARPGDRVTGDVARRAVRYDASTVYFLDDRSFPEPEAFWVGGARTSQVVVQPDESRGSVPIRLRNAPVANQVTLTAHDWRQVLDMGPGEEQRVEVPADAARGGTLLGVETTAGFRPAEQDPASRDQRFLGVWVRIEN